VDIERTSNLELDDANAICKVSRMDEKSREQKCDRAYRLAFEYESKYGCCPQCVIAAIEGVFNLKMDDVFKAGHSLAGGVGLSGNGTCGALSGGAMVLSYKYGRERKDFYRGRGMKSYALTKKLYDRFVKEFGSCICKDVQKRIMGRSFDLWDAGDYRKFEEAGGHRDKCPDVSGKVARWVSEIILASDRVS